MGKCYQIADARKRRTNRIVNEVLVENGQAIMPLVELIESGHLMIQDFMASVGQAALEAVLELSVQNIAGPAHQGRRGGEVRRYGKQQGAVCLATHKVRLQKPRLRHRSGKEVPVPAYEMMRSNPSLGKRVNKALLNGVSTRRYDDVVVDVAEACGVSKSSVSREFIESSSRQLEELSQRRFDELEILIVSIDGVQFGDHRVVGAIGVDSKGYKHVLGVAAGATENLVVVRGLLEKLVAAGLTPEQRRLFIIDGSKALRSAIDSVFGPHNPVQRCRHHKIENVLGYVSKDLKPQIKSAMIAAYKLEAKEGMAKLKIQVRWLEREYPSAAASLLEGLEETFTINRLNLPPELRRCLGTTNVIESPTSGVRLRTGRVTHWQSGEMVLRWCASALMATEKNFRRIMGYDKLWILKAALDEQQGVWDGQKIAA
jgi:transposase-like protein